MKTIEDRIHEWLFFAQSDLEAAEISLKEQLYHIVCFHSQQCVEKSLKAVLVSLEIIPPKIHNLIELLEKIVKNKPEFSTFAKNIDWLNRFYIPTRYPDAFPGSLPEGLPTEKDAEKAVEIAREIFEKGKEILEK